MVGKGTMQGEGALLEELVGKPGSHLAENLL